MRLYPRSEVFTPAEDWRWLGSAHATDTFEPCTLDNADFLTAFPTGVVPSGVVISKKANGRFTLGGAGASGEVGHLGATKVIGLAAGPTPAARMWHGQVVIANLPTGHGLNVAAAAKMPNINYVGTVPA